jgi:hypothetical protein
MIRSFRYKAFLSYSHQDRKWGRWLLRALETYRLPKHLVGRETKAGVVPKRLSPIFRDRDELPATESLSAEIRAALANSEYLIVVCSPEAAASPWVNKEIEEFRRQRGSGNILCAIVGGEPNAGTSDKFPPEVECFPPALRCQEDQAAEPIAADLRAGGDGKRLGRLKLVAGMIGLGLDEIIRRDLQRRHRRVTAVTLASVMAMIVMGGLTFKAIEAERKAEQRRAEAEGLIEFMLTDLRDKLEPVGRLDVLDAVGEEAVAYYAAQQLKTLPEDSLGRRARAFHLLGEIDDLQGDLEEAQARFEAASKATSDMLRRNPHDQQRIFDHSQSAFWVGAIKRRLGNYRASAEDIKEYKRLAEQLVAIDPQNLDWRMEVTYANSSLATLYMENLDQPQDALKIYEEILAQRIELFGASPKDPKRALDLANTYGWLADTAKIVSPLSEAEAYRTKQISLLDRVLRGHPDNVSAQGEAVTSQLGLARVEMAQGKALGAVGRLQKLVAKSEGLIAHDDTNTDWLEQAARHYLYLAAAQLLTDSLEEAETSLARSRQLIENFGNKSKLSFREKVQLTYHHRLLEAKISYLRRDLSAARDISDTIIQDMTKDIGTGSSATGAIQLLAEAFLLSGLTARETGNEAGAKADLRALAYLIEPRMAIEPPETIQLLANAYFLLGEIEKAQFLRARLKDRGYAKQNIYDSTNKLNQR